MLDVSVLSQRHSLQRECVPAPHLLARCGPLLGAGQRSCRGRGGGPRPAPARAAAALVLGVVAGERGRGGALLAAAAALLLLVALPVLLLPPAQPLRQPRRARRGGERRAGGQGVAAGHRARGRALARAGAGGLVLRGVQLALAILLLLVSDGGGVCSGFVRRSRDDCNCDNSLD